MCTRTHRKTLTKYKIISVIISFVFFVGMEKIFYKINEKKNKKMGKKWNINIKKYLRFRKQSAKNILQSTEYLNWPSNPYDVQYTQPHNTQYTIHTTQP